MGGLAEARTWAADVAREVGHPVTCRGFVRCGPSLAAARFELGHGLKVVLAQNRQAPIFAYQTWYRVGSKDERPDATGMAHLFEHLMFKATHAHPAGTFDREMERRGAQTNAATWVDWTYYTQALAAQGDNLATVAAFEADRMHNLVLDDATFQSELEVVKNERRMSVEDSVQGELSEALMALAFERHPYRWPTIGSMAHLEAAQVADLTAFYRRHYAPANAVVVVVGDIDWSEALACLVRAYAQVPAGTPPPARPWPAEPAQVAPRRRDLAREVMATQMVVGYRAMAQDHPDFVALEMLVEVLLSGDTGRLYQALVTDRELASEVEGSVHPFAEPGLVELQLALRPGVAPEAALDALADALAAAGRDILPYEMDKARHGLELAHLEVLADVEGLAELLGHFETNQGRFDEAFALVPKLARVTQADLARVAREVFTQARRSVVVAARDAGGVLA